MYISSRAIIYCGAKLPGEFIFPAMKYPPASTNLSIPAKAGISFSRQREFSAKRNIAMVAFGECGFAAEIPAFAGMEGCVELAAAFSFISPTPIPAKAGISLPSNCKKTMRCERCSPQQTGRFPPSREWKGGGGESRNLILATARIFREAEHCNVRLRRMRLRHRDSGFRQNGSRGGTSLFRSIPVQAKMKTGASIPKICANCYN